MLPPVRIDGDAEVVPPPARFAELVARFVAAAIAMAALFLLLAGVLGSAHTQAAIGDGGPSCIVRMTTGIECPFCGMTRATIALGAGDWHHAFGLHPLAPFVLAGALFLMAVVAIGRSRALLVGHRPVALLATIAAIWVVRLAA